MSNPLRWFRQNSKILVVFLGIGAMAIFGLGPVFDVLSRSSSYDQEGTNPVVAKWKGGDLKRYDLDAMLRRHYDLLRFQLGVQKAAQAQRGEEYEPLVAPIQPIRDSENTAQAQVDDQLVERMLLAEKASEDGFVISDSMIDDYLALLAGEAELTRSDLEQINNEANQRSCSLAQVRRQLKSELLYRQMRVMAFSGKPVIPNPTESMELYAKISNRIECEVIPVPVSQFIDEVTDEPSNATLRSLYKEGKTEYPDPSGKEPGFKIGRQLVAQYFIADYDVFLQNEINKLTDAEVEAEYDRLVATEDNLVMEVIPDETDDEIVVPDDSSEEEEPKSDGQSFNVRKMKNRRVSFQPQTEEADETPQVEEVIEDVVTEEVEGAADDDPVVDEAVVDEAVVEETVTEVTPTQESAADTAETDETTLDAEPSQTVEDASEDATSKAKATEPATEMKQEPAGVDAADSDSKTTEAKPKVADAAADEDDPLGPLLTDTPKLKKRAKPLREVADAIKRKLAAEDTGNAIKAALVEAQSQVSNYRGAYMNWKVNQQEGTKGEMPVFDYKAIAESLNLIPNETPLVDDEGLGKRTTRQDHDLDQRGFSWWSVSTSSRLCLELHFQQL